MIREKSLSCKLIRIKSSSKSLFDSFMHGFRPELRTCPYCGAKGSCGIHAYYGRSLVDFIHGKPVRHDLCILRVICSCGRTHAILPDLIILYSGYGLFFILRALRNTLQACTLWNRSAHVFPSSITSSATGFPDGMTIKRNG